MMKPQSPQGIVAIIDDDTQISRALTVWLDMHSLRAAHFVSAESLLQAVRTENGRLMLPIGITRPLVFPLAGAIIDLNLPGMSGIALSHRLHQAMPALPMVIISALAPEERARFGQPPADVICLKKPFDLDLLEDALYPLIRIASLETAG